MRSVDDQFAAVLYDRPNLIARLSADPELVVMFIEQRHDAFVLASRIFDMDRFANLSGRAQALSKITGEKRVSAKPVVVCASDDRRKADCLGVDKIRRGLDQMPRRGF